MPVQNYRATLKVTPIVDGGRSFVEWWATFDCAPEHLDERTAFFSQAFAGWLGWLRAIWTAANSSFDRPAANETAGVPAHTE